MAITKAPSYTSLMPGARLTAPKPKKVTQVLPTPTALQSGIRVARLEPGVASTIPAVRNALPAASFVTAPPPAYGPSSVPGTPTFQETAPGGGNASFNQDNAYLTEYKSDPLYIDALKNYNDQLAAGRLALTQAIRGAIVRGGWSDFADALKGNAGLSQYAGDIDAETLANAAANQFSDRAVIQRQLDQGLNVLPYNLSARGALRSGAAAVGARSLQDQFDAASNTARQNLIDALTQSAGGFATSSRDLQNAFQTQAQDIVTRLANARGYSQPTDALGYPTTNLGGPIDATPTPAGPSEKTVANVQKVKAALKPVPGYGAPLASKPSRPSTYYQVQRNMRMG